MYPNLSQKSTILVVDDTPTNLKVLLFYLNDSGFETLVAQDGESALKQLELVIPDLILLDIMMPGIDGFETCRRIKENPKTSDIPVIFMTALTGTIEKIKGFKSGAVDYITKPFHQEEVLARITTHLTIQRQKKELAKLNESLAESNATKEKFLSIIAHDMRNAFSPLLGYTDLMEKKVAKINNTQLIQYSKKIRNTTENIYKLMKNLLDWANIKRGVMEFDPYSHMMNDLVTECLQLLQETALQKNIELTSSVPIDTEVFADKNMVNTILRNLVYNAIKFTPSGGNILISSKDIDTLIEIAVADSGVGIETDKINKLFHIDQNIKEIGTNGEEGTGLGLILCKELVEKNNGTIRVESIYGKGTTFYFTLQKPKAEL